LLKPETEMIMVPRAPMRPTIVWPQLRYRENKSRDTVRRESVVILSVELAMGMLR
jgi:hypothetical protein